MLIKDLFPNDLFAGKTVFVTGGSGGINLAIARNFAALGANLSICGRNRDRLAGAVKQLEEFGNPVSGHAADVRDYAALDAAITSTAGAFGGIDVLVNGAAGNFRVRAEDLSPNGFKSVMDIDVLGSFHACRAAFDHLRRSRGCIIFVSAGQAYIPFAMQVHVGAAKAGVDSLMRNLALEWGYYGIRCNSISPGPIEGTGGLAQMSSDAIRTGWLEATPLGRLGTGDDVGQAAVFLASPLASYITGTRLDVDGGVNLEGTTLRRQATESNFPRKFKPEPQP